jgi:DNA-binding transcriptional ArsR family regulator
MYWMACAMIETKQIEQFGEGECPVPYELSSDMKIKVKQAMSEDMAHISSLLKVLADPIRLRILKALEVCDLCVCVLVEITDHKYSALSYHLKLLKEAGLVESKRDGSFQIYFLTEFGVKIVASIGRII